VPYLGICFGMQMAVIERRAIWPASRARSTEFGECEHPIVGLMTEWMRGNELEDAGRQPAIWAAPLRLGAYPCHTSRTPARGIYGQEEISERHATAMRSTSIYRSALEQAGLRFSGLSPDGQLPEIVEIPDHPWFIGVHFHRN